MQVDADVIALFECGLSRVKTHPHPERRATRPRVLGVGALTVDCCVDRAGRLLEDDAELVRTGVYLLTARLLERAPNEPAVVSHGDPVVVAQTLQQTRRV